MMKNTLMLVLCSVVIMSNLYSQTGKSIKINYQHSRRNPYNKIEIELLKIGEVYQINIKTMQMEGKIGYEYSNTENRIVIDETEFNDLYQKLLNLNFKEIIKNNDYVIGGDGVKIQIVIGNYLNNVSLNIWSPDFDSEKRKTSSINEILIDIFKLVGLSEWL